MVGGGVVGNPVELSPIIMKNEVGRLVPSSRGGGIPSKIPTRKPDAVAGAAPTRGNRGASWESAKSLRTCKAGEGTDGHDSLEIVSPLTRGHGTSGRGDGRARRHCAWPCRECSKVGQKLMDCPFHLPDGGQTRRQVGGRL